MAVNSTFHLRVKVKGNKDLCCSTHTESTSENESPLCMHSFAFLLTEWGLMGIFIYGPVGKRKHRSCSLSSCGCRFHAVESWQMICVYKVQFPQ